MNTDIIPGSILLAFDGADHGDRAILWASEQAWLERRHLTVVTATTGSIDEARAVAHETLAVIAVLRPGVEADAAVMVGDPARILVELSARAHTIVIGSRGRGPLRSKLLGSVSAAVSRDAECPVVVCRPYHWRPAQDIDAGVVVGAEGTRESLPVIEYAFEQAALRGLPLTVLHCGWDEVAAMQGPTLVGPATAGPEEQRLMLAESVAGFSGKYPDVHVDLQLARGLADDVLAAGSERWDLLVVGRHRAPGRLLPGGVTTSVVEHARTVVAVVPEVEPASTATRH